MYNPQMPFNRYFKVIHYYWHFPLKFKKMLSLLHNLQNSRPLFRVTS